MSTQRRLLAGLGGFVLAAGALAAAALPTPEAHFGFKPGADGLLVDYEQILDYLKVLDAASPRLELREIGRSPMGKPMVVAFISSEENLKRLDELHAINRRLALDAAIPDSRARRPRRPRPGLPAGDALHARQRAGARPGVPALRPRARHHRGPGDRSASSTTSSGWWSPPTTRTASTWSSPTTARTRARKWDGASLPSVYHRYVGHDNNRDFVTLTQEDNRAVSRIMSTEWFPQVMVEKHGMGSSGPRFYCPPSHDPIAENIEANLWSWIAIFGTNMAHDMAHDGLSGVAQHWAFDDYWPGSTETAIWKNVIGLLTENATANDASPIFIEPTELNADDKGLAEYKKSVNFLDPWPGGWWRLGDAVTYELSSFRSLLRTASLNRAEVLQFRNDICRREVKRGQSQAPYYFVLPPGQRDRGEWAKLVNLLMEHGVQVFTVARRLTAGGRHFEPGSVVIPLAQPYRPFIKEVMEKQRFPVRHFTPDGEMIDPYDITSWSLPLHRGVTSEQVDTRIPELEAALQPVEGAFRPGVPVTTLPAGTWGIAFSANENEAFHAAFLALKAGLPVSRATAAIRGRRGDLARRQLRDPSRC